MDAAINRFYGGKEGGWWYNIPLIRYEYNQKDIGLINYL